MPKYVWNNLKIKKDLNTIKIDFALLILNQPITCDPEFIKTLWTKAQIRGLVDGGSNRWLDFIKEQNCENLQLPDFISGDFDSILPETKNYFESKNVTLVPTPDQNYTDFTKALKYIKKEIEEKNLNVKNIFVICENGGRFDQIMGNVNTLHCSIDLYTHIDITLISSESVTWVLPPGEHVINVPDYFIEKKYTCGLIPFRGGTIITTRGLKWNLNKTVSEFGKLISCCNLYSSNEIYVKCSKHLLWTSEYC
ncbi:Thiamin pyrophosphokinase, putative [Pediculus humanus corporis]|uniref:Thiamin pyrophosphokinase, putative n=1 Tax=Pediculus humanus subsp. corporis TaxID=121224 RepID=E0VZ06_PEDHC|nr:thiamine pyrophosphokinase, putative [Pediculus humanus corporis]EEB18612.1 Thiamin pyrophosphokinase, putative [Pediculus humanus corporis]